MAKKTLPARELAAAKRAAQILADKIGRAVRVSVDDLRGKPAKSSADKKRMTRNPSPRADSAQKAAYKRRYDRAMREAKDKTRSETYRAAAKAEAARIKRAYL